jgi:hypothetical protein
MPNSPDPTTLSSEDHSMRQLLFRYALRYYISGPQRDALVEQTLAALSHDPDQLLNGPIERAIALTMHQIFLSNTTLKPRLKSRSEYRLPNAEPGIGL